MQQRFFSGVLLLTASSLLMGGIASPTKAEPVYRGVASWYGPGLSGNRTANGEPFNPRELTAAHPSLPFGTQVRVTNIENGRSVVVRINDRLGDERFIIDLSTAAANVIGLIDVGTAPVKMEILGKE